MGVAFTDIAKNASGQRSGYFVGACIKMFSLVRRLLYAVVLVLAFSNHAFADPIINKLGDGVYHVWEAFYSSLIVVGDDQVLVTDPANRSRAKFLQKFIASITNAPVTKIVFTHEHYDHVGGVEVFPAAELICHQNCQSVFILDESGKAPDKVDITFNNYLSINVGDNLIELHHFGAADGVASTLIHLPKQAVVVTADLYANRTLTEPTFMDDVNYLGVLRILNKAVALNPKYAITSHSPNINPMELELASGFVNELYRQTKAVLDQVLAEGGGFPAFLAAMPMLHEKVTMPEYQHWKGYDAYLSKHVQRMALSLFHGG